VRSRATWTLLSSRRIAIALVAAFLVLASLVWVGPQAVSVGAASVTLPEAQTFATADTFHDVVPGDNGDVLAGFVGDVRVVLTVDVGAIRIGGGSTFSGSPNYELTVGSATVVVPQGYRTGDFASFGNGASELAVVGSVDDVNVILEEIQFKRTSGASSLVVSAVKTDSEGAIAYDPDTGHYFEFIDELTDPTWQNARCLAKFLNGSYDSGSSRFDKCDEDELTPRTFNGFSGYLATITSSDENDFVNEKAGSTSAWLGGSDLAVTRTMGSNSDIAATNNTWRWVDGPEAGKVFWVTACGTGNKGACTELGVDASTQYNQWSGSEPNDSAGEEALQILSGGTGDWNDLPWDSHELPLIVEYGGITGETALEQVERSVALSVAVDGPPTNPVGVSGNETVSVSWTAPVLVSGATVTSYTVTASPGSATCVTATTSCVVSGLTNGTAYTFVVVATFSDSNTRTSVASAEVTPVVPPADPAPAPEQSSPSPSPAIEPAPASAPAPIVAPVQIGPVLRGNIPPSPSSAPVARVGGQVVPVTTDFRSARAAEFRAGTLVLALDLAASEGEIQNREDSETEVVLEQGGAVRFSGSGVLPGSRVQFFLPLLGQNARELANIEPEEDGSFSGSALFASTAEDDPLPIGRTVLQVVSVTPLGQQAVLEMAVNIAQGPPMPETVRGQSQPPVEELGAFSATRAGLAESVAVSSNSEDSFAVVDGDSWWISLSLDPQSADDSTVKEGATLVMVRDSIADLAGSGFMPGTRAEIWLFSAPTLLGTATVDAEGSFTGEVLVDSFAVAVGQHTLQLRGVGEDGYIRAANLGVTVEDAVANESIDPTSRSLELGTWVLVVLAIATAGVLISIVIWRRRA